MRKDRQWCEHRMSMGIAGILVSVRIRGLREDVKISRLLCVKSYVGLEWTRGE